MAARLLRHYRAVTSATTVVTVAAAPGTARSLVISKIVLANTTAGALTVNLLIGPGTAAEAADLVTGNISIPGFSVYTETGLVQLATETIRMQGSASGITASVHGEEVDN